MTPAPRLAAAVLVPVRREPPHALLFIRRAAHLRRHAGQIAFPGGRLDDADGGDLERAALREAHEEIGLEPQRVMLVAPLRPFSQRVGPFDIAPFVGVVDGDAPLVPDPAEVAAIHEIPLSEVLAPDAVHRGVETVGAIDVPTWIFDAGNVHVWGATGHILARFVDAYHAAGGTLRAALARAGVTVP